MTAPAPLDEATAKRRFLLFVLFKFGGLGALVAGVLLARGGSKFAGIALLVIGAASLFVRPRHLGLTAPPPTPTP